MGRLKTETIVRHSADMKEFMKVSFTVNVTTEGQFSTTLKPEDVDTIEAAGVSLEHHRNRMNNKGFFDAPTLSALNLQVAEVLDECLSRVLESEVIIIRYAIRSTCSFGLTVDGEIIPNLNWETDGEVDQQKGWQDGSHSTHSASPAATGVLFYAKPFVKRSFRYKSGDVRVEYGNIEEWDHHGNTETPTDETNYNLRYLDTIAATVPPSGYKVRTVEMDYNEDRAAFFVKLYKGLCKLAFMLGTLHDKDKMIQMIESGGQLFLTAPPNQIEE
jgi:hypothetical protein